MYNTSLLVGNIKTLNLVTVTRPFRTEYKYSYLTSLTTSLLFAFVIKYQVENGKEVKTNAK